MKKRILVVEDEEHIADGLRITLEAEGYETVVAADGNAALELWRNGAFDLIILDVMLPGTDGLEICKTIRGSGDRIPILFLTARDREDDRIAGLLAGADDYLTKPFNLKELLLRVAAMFRRQVWYGTSTLDSERYSFADFWIDFKSYRAKGVSGEEELSQKECMIMKFLVEHAEEVVTRDMILDAVWGYNLYPSSRTVDNFIVRLRKLFEENPSHPRYLHTVRGAGYRFTPSGDTDNQ
ncbi:MAG: response regulator transcription factor [candidate division Zixibacteria bacterium]|nr:response regulator transcription factor [candidate division Zixibacteria bacterium]MBU1470127.1 response regulator transcription factor [candidate division Zixibacteria bacterium]MBU2626486.1 response regulator transcription factor [candidate division Zixibacteria bacterium]